jgi:ribulose-phosphate 3-epimerase
MPPRVIPSILSANFANLLQDIQTMERAGAEVLHVDVMDGHFVPNITVGVPVVRAIRQITKLELDVHLMVTNPEQMAPAFAEAGANWISVQYESALHLDRLLHLIEEHGVRPGVALNPHTPVLLLEEALHLCHHVLIMSVNPGFGGQKFISTSFQKVRKLRDLIRSRDLDVKIEIDGGIGPGNTAEAVRNGADLLVSGSAIFRSQRPADVFREMKRIAEEAGELKHNDALLL